MPVILFFICLCASAVGAVVGAGGGVIIKPVLDLFGLLPVSTASFCSSCTVFCMAVSSLVRTRDSGVRLQLRVSTPLAGGAILGGLLGQWLFGLVRTSFARENVLGAIQAALLTAVMLLVMLYICEKDRLPSKHIENLFAISAIGLGLGLTSSFLGIGGGPYNVAALFFFFSMDAKTAAKNSLYVIALSQASSIAFAAAAGSVPAFAPLHLAGMIAGGIGGALLGAAISRRLDNSGVERILKLLVLFITAVDLYNVFRFISQR